MKQLFLVILVFTAILTGCAAKSNNITFTAVIEDVSEYGLLVTTTDEVGFDKASVGYHQDLKLDFQPAAGQTVIITIQPEIRESYPVQVTAVKIVLPEDLNVTPKAEYIKITPEEAKSMIDTGEVVILDVRTEDEYQQGHIQNSILIPDTEIRDKAQEILSDKNAKILVYCRTGRRSALASETLLEMGFTKVYDFGGIFDWPYEIVK